MTRYELARDKRITISALVLEVLSVISVFLLFDAFLGNQICRGGQGICAYVWPFILKTGLQPVMSNHLSFGVAAGIVILIQYFLVAIEMIARYRADKFGFTFPLVFLPFGHILRLMLMIALEIIVVSIKLLVYFISVLLQFVFLILRIDKRIGSAHIVDITDRLLEPLERFVNATYNFLYFNKIQTNGNIFNAVFNGNLTFWCINH